MFSLKNLMVASESLSQNYIEVLVDWNEECFQSFFINTIYLFISLTPISIHAGSVLDVKDTSVKKSSCFPVLLLLLLLILFCVLLLSLTWVLDNPAAQSLDLLSSSLVRVGLKKKCPDSKYFRFLQAIQYLFQLLSSTSVAPKCVHGQYMKERNTWLCFNEVFLPEQGVS